MAECGNGLIVVTRICLFVSVFQMVRRQTVESKSIPLDVSRVRINPLECYDRTKTCAKEASNGYCESNYHYMIDRCPWSCRFCRRVGGDTENCKDISKHCAKWVSKKECRTRPDYMAQNCKKSCEMCGPESDYNVTDKESSCSLWAKAGWCQANTDLLDKCPHSCQKYGVQGASSLEERYVTVNFGDTSSAKVPTFSDFMAPPPPPGGISPNSDINLLPPDLQVALANEWWDSELYKLTKKQNEYVTHPEPRPLSLSLKQRNSKEENLTRNDTARIDNTNKKETIAGKKIALIDPTEEGEMLSVSASAPSPKAYDTLLPKLFLSSGPSWTKQEKSEDTSYMPEGKQKIWKTQEEKANDDFDNSGQEKEGLPLLELEMQDEHSGMRNRDLEMSSSGSGLIVIEGGNDQLVMIASGENETDDQENAEKNATISLLASGSSEEIKDEDISGEANESSGDNPWGFANSISGSGADGMARKHRIPFYSSGSGQSQERVEIFSPEKSFSGSGDLQTLYTSSAFEDSTSGSDQYDYE